MLHIRVKTTGMEITPALSEYVHKKVEVLEKFIGLDSDALAEVEIGRTTNHHHKGDVYKAEINVTVGKNIYRVESIESDLYMAIDMMKDRVAQEIAKSKDKKTSLFKRGGFKMKEALKKLTR